MELKKHKTIEVHCAGNGFIIKENIYDHTDDDGKDIFDEKVSIINMDSDKEDLTKVFELIADWFGYSYDKYGKENLKISWDKKGHRVEEEENGKD